MSELSSLLIVYVFYVLSRKLKRDGIKYNRRDILKNENVTKKLNRRILIIES